GDTVELTFTDEQGAPQKVTLTKGDNGWTSDKPEVVPDSTGNSAVIAADKVKDNSDVTAVAKDPSHNTSDPVTATAGAAPDTT
ncbi:hypothetical protein GW736_27640, partial [Escherichia coli]|nr:hypothetical protein [Escherichia coli]